MLDVQVIGSAEWFRLLVIRYLLSVIGYCYTPRGMDLPKLLKNQQLSVNRYRVSNISDRGNGPEPFPNNK